MTHAVISTGGKQYVVTPGQKVRVEKLAADEGKKITFSEVLLTSSDKATAVGTPFVAGAKVEGTVIRHAKADKVMGVKMKAKKRHKKYFGHRQPFTEIEITNIVGGK